LAFGSSRANAPLAEKNLFQPTPNDSNTAQRNAAIKRSSTESAMARKLNARIAAKSLRK
jgi:hypothetical protein